MPIENLGTKHLTAAQKTAIDDALTALTTALTSVSQNLTDEERSKYGSVNEQNKLFVNKVADYHSNQPTLQSSDVDWAEFDKDFADRQFADTRENTLRGILRMLTDFKIVHDFDNYQNGLTDYEYSQYKANTNATGFATKVTELKQFFPRTGTGTNIQNS